MDSSTFEKLEHEDMAVMFADVTGCVGIYNQLGNKDGLKLVGRCVRLMEAVTEDRAGRVVKKIGDEVMCRFDSADDAMQAAFNIMEQVEDMPAYKGIKLQVKIGLEADQAIAAPDGDVFGEAVNMAARMVGKAKPGQILTTESSIKKLSAQFRMMAHCIGPVSIKGLEHKVTIFDMNWHQGEVTGFIPRPAAMNTQKKLILKHGEESITLSAEGGKVSIGKSPDNSLAVDGDFTSRNHADISWESRRFVLKDHSRNGTFFKTSSGAEMHVHQGQADLTSEGTLCFGMSHAETPPYQYVHLSWGK